MLPPAYLFAVLAQVGATPSADDYYVPQVETETPVEVQFWTTVGVGLVLLFGAVLAISMLRGGRLGQWWYYGGRSRAEHDRRAHPFNPLRRRSRH